MEIFNGGMMRTAFTFGSDPECMVISKSGEPLSAIKLMKGYGKDAKYSIGNDQYMFYDNVLLEFNIKPAETCSEFKTNLSHCLFFAKDYLSQFDAHLAFLASAEFSAKQRSDPEAKIFGCDPEYNIYKRNKNNQIVRCNPPSTTGALRTCGGHIHIGHPIAAPNFEEGGNPPLVIKLMDAFVGATSLMLDKDPTSAKRRAMYGGAGTHRIANYGVEYRTLSNFWLADPMLVELIYRLTRQVIEFAMTNPTIIDSIVSPQELQGIINENKVDDARMLYKQLEPHLACELQNSIEINATRRIRYNWMELWHEETLNTKKKTIPA